MKNKKNKKKKVDHSIVDEGFEINLDDNTETEKELVLTEEDIIGDSGLVIDEDTISGNDFLLGGDSDLSIKLGGVTEDKYRHFYNQGAQKRTRMACTLYMGIGMISDMTDYEFSLKEILEICDLAEKEYGWSESQGGRLHKAIDCVRTWWNEKHKNDVSKQLISFRVEIGSPEFDKLTEAGKSIGIGYHTSREHYKDSQDNGEINSKSFTNALKRGGHAIRYNKDTDIDNYINTKDYNSYKNERIRELGREGTYFNWGYVYFMKKESVFKDLPSNHPKYERIMKLVKMGLLKGYPDGTIRPDELISRGDLFVFADRIIDAVKDGKIRS